MFLTKYSAYIKLIVYYNSNSNFIYTLIVN